MRIVLVVLMVSLFAAACSQPAVNTQANNAAKANSPNTNTNASANANKPSPRFAEVAVDPAADSVYTDISEKVCKEQEPEEDSGAIFQMECPGTAGYKYVFSESDHSQVLSVIDPKGKETLLQFRKVLNTVSDFYMGNKVEWRMDGKGEGAKPHAMIVRLTKFTDPEDRNKTETFLVVTRVGEETCVTDLVPASADQNKKAREFADTKGRKCMDLGKE